MEYDYILNKWLEICSVLIETENNPSQFIAYCQRMVPQVLSNGYLLLSVDNEFIKNQIENIYIEKITKVASQLFNNNFTIDIVVDTTNSTDDQRNYIRSLDDSNPIKQSYNFIFKNKDRLQNTIDKSKNTLINTKKIKKNKNEEYKIISTQLFDNFIIGESNNLAYQKAWDVSKNPGKSPHLNPLFIYGKSGLGKTHLLLAIKNKINTEKPELNVIYDATDAFVNRYVSIGQDSLNYNLSYNNLREKYENADVLILDDVQIFQGKQKSLDMLFQIYNILKNQGKQIILAADRAPRNLEIDERYTSRFNEGMNVQIDPPEIETKVAILESYLREILKTDHVDDFGLDDDIKFYIAENSGSNVRELKSALSKVYAEIIQSPEEEFTLDNAQLLLAEHFSKSRLKRYTYKDVIENVCRFYNIKQNDVLSSKRDREITFTRQICMYMCRNYLNMTYQDIAKKFNKGHASVMYSTGEITKKLNSRTNIKLKEELEIIKRKIFD